VAGLMPLIFGALQTNTKKSGKAVVTAIRSERQL